MTNLPSGEPSLCFEDERGDYGNEQFTPVFEPLYLAAPAQAAIDAREKVSMASKMEVESWRRSLLVWREASHAELIENTAGLKQCLSNAARLLLDHPSLASRDAAPAPAAAGGVTDAFTAAYMAACKGRAPDHNEIGLHYFRAGAALAQSVPVQPSNGCEVNEYSSRVCERGTRSCTASHEAAPVQQEALQEAHRLGFLRAAGWMQCDKLFADVNGSTYRKDRDHDVATIALTPPAVAAPAQAGETKGDA
ncbi:hypothetical protein APR51_08090 [Variovorax paradoxus]|nr:hypothetical protein APR52_20890 [Variovorax paradoxus]KPV23308.1 hypothetical protein APR51_08090 [Variovorax paradoxus]